MATIAVVAKADKDRAFSKDLAGLVRRFGDEVITVDDVRASVLRAVDVVIARAACDELAALTGDGRPPVVALGADDPAAAYARGVDYCVIEPFHPRELLSQLYATRRRHRRVVCLGGGAGLYTLLVGLKTLRRTHLTSVVSVCDDGGSSGRIRQAFGILPPGDIRRSLVALSTAPAVMNQLMQYRFPGGDDGLRDHNLGNLLFTAMANMTGSPAEAARAMGDILDIQGVVLPVSEQLCELCAEMEDGSVVRGEHRIDVPDGRDPRLRIRRLWQEPQAEVNPNVVSAILAADAVTIGPGDLFTSVLATLAVRGVPEALRATPARVIYVGNLMTKPGETAGFTAADHVREVVRVLGPGAVDDVLVAEPRWSDESIAVYASQGQEPVALDLDALSDFGARVTVRDIGSERELVRHHSRRLAAAIDELIASPA